MERFTHNFFLKKKIKMPVDYDSFKTSLVCIPTDLDLLSNYVTRSITAIFWSVWLVWSSCGSRGSLSEVLSICKNKSKSKLKDQPDTDCEIASFSFYFFKKTPPEVNALGLL